MPFNRLRDNNPSKWSQRATTWTRNLTVLASIRRRRKLPEALYHCAASMVESNGEVMRHIRRSIKISHTNFAVNLSMFTNEACVALFRFGQRDLEKVINVMSWPSGKRRTNGNQYAVNPQLAACVVLRRLATPARWFDLEALFGKFSPQLAEIFREALDHFMTAQGHLVTTSIPAQYMARRAVRFADRILEKSQGLDNCVAFIDGTVIGVSRPGGHGIDQRVVYNGHKRKHALKYQAITTPDGMCVHLFGPEVGRRHDMFLYAASGADAMLEGILEIDGRQYVVYGDSGYSARVFLEIPFDGASLSAVKKAFNKAMSKSRVTVEWFFKEVKLLWSFVDCKRRLRLKQMPVGLLYRAAVLLTNFRNCVEANEISQFFNCPPPSLDEYISTR